MAIDLNETLDGLLQQIGSSEDPFKIDIYTSVEQIEDDDHPYYELIEVDDILWKEFRKYFPDEFNKYIAEIATYSSGFVDFIETRINADEIIREIARSMKNKGLDPEEELESAWSKFLGSHLNALIQFSVEFGNNDDSTMPVEISRYYGNSGAVYQIKHQGEGGNFRSMGSQFLQNPELMNGHPNRLMRELFEEEQYTIAFSNNGKEAYLMYKSNNPATLH